MLKADGDEEVKMIVETRDWTKAKMKSARHELMDMEVVLVLVLVLVLRCVAAAAAERTEWDRAGREKAH